MNNCHFTQYNFLSFIIIIIVICVFFFLSLCLFADFNHDCFPFHVKATLNHCGMLQLGQIGCSVSGKQFHKPFIMIICVFHFFIGGGYNDFRRIHCVFQRVTINNERHALRDLVT